MICTSLGNIGFDEALRCAAANDLIEIRADLLNFSNEQYHSLFKQKAGIVFTCRKDNTNEEIRRSLFRMAVENGAKYIDLEIESAGSDLEWVKGLCSETGTELIISYHNYQETPAENELISILKECYRLGADVAKIATMVNTDGDMVKLLSLYRKQGRKVVIGMGEKGILTRVAALGMGAEFSFAAPDNAGGTAPGQLSLSAMNEIRKLLKF